MLIPITRTVKNFYLLYYVMGLLLPLCCSYLSVIFGLIQQLFVCCQNDSFKSCLILFQFLARLFPIFPYCIGHVSFHGFSFPLYMQRHSLLVQAVYTCLVIFAGRCAVDRIKFTFLGFYRFHTTQCSALQLLPPLVHIPCTLPVCLVYRIFRSTYSLCIHFCSFCCSFSS